MLGCCKALAPSCSARRTRSSSDWLIFFRCLLIIRLFQELAKAKHPTLSPPACRATRKQLLARSRGGVVRGAASGTSPSTTTTDCASALAARDARIAELESQLATLQAYVNATEAELADAYAQVADVNGQLYAAFQSVSCCRARLP